MPSLTRLSAPSDATSTSLASLVREATSLMLECYDAGAGVDETVIREMKSVEKVMMPERNDMRVSGDLVWAVKQRE